MANAFTINPGGGYDVGGALTGLGQQFKQQQMQDEQQVQQQQMQELFTGASQGDPEAMSQLWGSNPEMAQMFEQRNAKKIADLGAEKAFESKKAETEWGLKWKQATPEQKPQLLQEALANDLIDIDDDDVGIEGAQADLAVNAMLYGHLGKDAYKDLGLGGVNKSTGKLGTVSPKDFSVASMAKYEQSGNIEDLERYSPKTVEVAGVLHSLNPTTQKWEPIIDATSSNLTEQANAVAVLEADKKSREDFGKSKVAWRTGRPKFRSKIASSKASQKILEATSKQLKNNINNWTTKYGASLSSLPGSQARMLKNQLNTLKAHSAFSTLTDLKDSGGTLGAISEAELVLLEAKLGALDQGGDATELMRVIDQIVNSNIESIGRLETEFYNTNAMYSAGYDELQAVNQPKAKQQDQVINWADL